MFSNILVYQCKIKIDLGKRKVSGRFPALRTSLLSFESTPARQTYVVLSCKRLQSKSSIQKCSCTTKLVQTEYSTPVEVLFEVCLSKMHLLSCGFYELIYITHYGAFFFHRIVDSACDPLEACLVSVKLLCRQLFPTMSLVVNYCCPLFAVVHVTVKYLVFLLQKECFSLKTLSLFPFVF